MSGSASDFDDKAVFADTVAVNCSGRTGTVKDPGAGRRDFYNTLIEVRGIANSYYEKVFIGFGCGNEYNSICDVARCYHFVE